MAGLSTIVQAEAAAAALNKLTGTPATVRHFEDYSEVYFSNPKQTQEWVEKQLKPGRPGAVRVSFGPVVYPVAAKRIVPVVLGIFAAGYLLGRFTR